MNKSYYKKITLVLVTYNSRSLIHQCFRNIDHRLKKIIVDNSNDFSLKKYFSKKYKNTTIILNKNNVGYGKSINIASKKINTKYFMIITHDISLRKNALREMFFMAEKHKNFGIIGPNYTNIKINSLENNQLKFVLGSAMFFNKKDFFKIGGFDESFFLYFEDNDICKRFLNRGYKLLLCKKAYVTHNEYSLRNKKIKEVYNEKNKIIRNWHFMWSYFYFNKKHYNVVIAIIKVFPILIRSLFKYFIFSITNNNKKKIYYARASGIFNSMINKKNV